LNWNSSFRKRSDPKPDSAKTIRSDSPASEMNETWRSGGTITGREWMVKRALEHDPTGRRGVRTLYSLGGVRLPRFAGEDRLGVES
jgi:hypothetical protein